MENQKITMDIMEVMEDKRFIREADMLVNELFDKADLNYDKTDIRFRITNDAEAMLKAFFRGQYKATLERLQKEAKDEIAE